MKTLDKKQVPQFAALCVVTAGVFGYLVVHFVAPNTASAGTLPAGPARPAVPALAAGHAAAAAPSGKAGDGTKPGNGANAGAAASTDIPDAPPPSPAMHDPFAIGYADPAPAAPAAPAAAPVPGPALPKLPAPGKRLAGVGAFSPLPVGPSAPALPGRLSPFPVHPSGPVAGEVAGLPAGAAAPAAPAAPAWTVTGVLLGASGKVAILRSGEARRIVRAGDFVDATYRVTGVTRTSVVLRHGATMYQLPLGGAKAVPAALPSAPAAAPPPLPLPQSAAVMDGTLIPLRHLSPAHLPLAHGKHSEQVGLVAAAPSVPKPASSAAPAKVAASISLGLRLLDGSVLAQNQKE